MTLLANLQETNNMLIIAKEKTSNYKNNKTN